MKAWTTDSIDTKRHLLPRRVRRQGLATTAVLLLGVAAFTGGPGRAQFFPPGVLNPDAGSDSGGDWRPAHVIDVFGDIHVVWSSAHDVTGTSGSDRDIFYARLSNGAWSAPELVSRHGPQDTQRVDDDARIVVAGGIAHVVWGSELSPGGRSDVFYARRLGDVWSFAEQLSVPSQQTLGDARPNLVVRRTGGMMAVWDTTTTLGSFLQWSMRTPGANAWATPQLLNQAIVGGVHHWGPVALTSAADGTVFAAWSTNGDPPNISLGGDYDIVFAEFAPPPFEAWSPMIPASIALDQDSGDDYTPVVALVNGANGEELHFVWTSTEDVGGSGNDLDLLHAVFNRKWQFRHIATVVNTTAGVDFNDPDQWPSLCVEPGGVVHLVWASPLNLGLLTGSDWDVYYASNATGGSDWSPVHLLGWNAPFDGPVSQDIAPNIACGPNAVLSGVWSSTDPLGGPIGSDHDLLHAIGRGRGVSRPEPIDLQMRLDSGIEDFVSMAADAKGLLHAVWTSEKPAVDSVIVGADADILHATYDGTAWSAPMIVNTSAGSDSGIDDHPDVRLDAAGDPHVVWTSDQDFGGVLGPDPDVFYSVRRGGVWVDPVLVNLVGETDSPTAYDGQVDFELDSSGVAHVVWVTGDGSVEYSTGTSDGFTAQETLFAGLAERPDIALDSMDTPHVVFPSIADIGGSGQDRDIWYMRRRGSSWSSPEAINAAETDGSVPDLDVALIIDGGDVAQAVWRRGSAVDDALFYARLQGGGWSAPVPLFQSSPTDRGFDHVPRLALDAQGALHVLWTSDDPRDFDLAGSDYDLLYAVIPPGAVPPVNVPIQLANASGWADQPTALDVGQALVVDARGQVHFGWASTSDLGDTMGTDADVLHAYIPLPALMFADGFESGNVSAWSSSG